jgi:hypothetical protein
MAKVFEDYLSRGKPICFSTGGVLMCKSRRETKKWIEAVQCPPPNHGNADSTIYEI